MIRQVVQIQINQHEFIPWLSEAHSFESCLVERIALLLWRLRRVTAFETETMIGAADDSDAAWERAEETRKEMAAIPFYGKDAREHPPVKEEWLKRRQSDQIIPKGATLERVMRYEAHPSTGLRAGSFDLAQGRLLRPSSGQAPST